LALKAIEMIKADALAIHLNTLQEAIQPEGETNYIGVLNKIGEITQSLSIPIIVKETGAGIASEEAKKLEEIGVTGINVAGAGGTSWAAVEYYRAKKVKDDFRQRLGKTFWNWGIPTAVSLVEVAQSVHLPIISSGGIRSGVDVAKSLALGADLTGMALPVLLPATRNSEEVKNMLRFLIEELKNAMFLSGADSIKALDRIPLVITGKTFEWLKIRGFQPELYANRKSSA
jgi:isopentenyl-diphosphate delta-isomerase